MQKDVTLSTRVSSDLRDAINEDAEETGVSQAEWLRSAAESYLGAGGKEADLLMLTPEDKLQIIKNHIKLIEDYDETDNLLDEEINDFKEDLEILQDRYDDLDEDDKNYEELLDDLDEQLDSLLDQVNDLLDDCENGTNEKHEEEEDNDEEEDQDNE